MPYDMLKRFVVGVSTRALFELAAENEIFEAHGMTAYAKHQHRNEENILDKGTAFPLIQSLLGLNEYLPEDRTIEVIILSKNDFNTSLRVWNSVKSHKLAITRGSFTGGGKVSDYLRAYNVGLFLSADQSDVQEAFRSGIPAGHVYGTPVGKRKSELAQIRIAFDGDAVIFGDESERINKEQGLEKFMEYERDNARVPMKDGPFAKVLVALTYLQKHLPDEHKGLIRTALITARNSPAHERVIRTLRSRGLRVDEAHFLGGISKNEVLKAFDPHIFFDDQQSHCGRASRLVPTAKVMSTLDTDTTGTNVVIFVPECPLCGCAMSKRTAKKGKTKGRPFWGCGEYPSCRGNISIA